MTNKEMTDAEKLEYINSNLKEFMQMTGNTEEELLEQYKWVKENITYVRVKTGKCKGKAGYMFPNTSDELYPYTRFVYLSDGTTLMCNGWSWIRNLIEISKEEYEAELKGKKNDT